MPFFQITGSHLVQCHLQMECTETSLAYLMSYVPENKLAAYFPVAKNHVLSEIMLELSVHTCIYEKKPFSHPWAHFEHPSLVHFGSWVNSQAKVIRPVSFSFFHFHHLLPFFTANLTGYSRLLGEETSRNHQAYKERPPRHHNIIRNKGCEEVRLN